MAPRLESIADQIQEHLTPQRILEIINYRVDTVLAQDATVKAFCPIHGELVFRTLIIDPGQKRFRCSYSLCPGNTGGDLIDLYALAKKTGRTEAMKLLLTHIPVSVDWDAARLEAEAASEEEAVAEETRAPEEHPAAVGADLLERPNRSEVETPPVDEAPSRREKAEKPKRRDPLAEAEALLEEKRYDEAERLFTKVAAADRTNALRALMGRAKCLEALDRREPLGKLYPKIIAAALAAGEVTAAQAYFRRHCEAAVSVGEILEVLQTLAEPCRKATTGISPLLEAVMARAEKCESHGDFAAALALYRAAEPFAPPELDLTSFVTSLLCQLGRTDEALQVHEEQLGRARQAGDLAAALDCLRAMIELDPTRADFRQGFIETAIEDGLSPELFREVLGIIDVWIGESEFGLAREALDLLAHYLPNEAAIQQRLWTIARDQGDDQGAKATALRLAQLHRQEGRPDEAVHYLEMLPRDTGSPEHIEVLAQCLFDAGQIDRAVETLTGLARHYEAAGAFAASEPLYERLTLWQSQEPRWRAKQAKCKQSMGQTAAALALYEQAGMEFLAFGRLEEAADVWTEALTIDPAAIDIAQAQYNLLNQLDRAKDARRLLTSTVNYLKLNRGPKAAAEFFSGCVGTREPSIESSLLLSDLWGQAENRDQAIAALRAAMSRARRENDTEALIRLAQRWLAHDPTDTAALEILAQHGPTSSNASERRRMMVQLGETYLAHEDWERAAGVYATLLEAEPGEPRFLEKLMLCHEKRGDLDAAHRLRFHLAERHYAQGQWTACQELLAPLTAGRRPEPVVQHLLLQCHIHQGETAPAERLAEALLAQAREAGDFDAAITVAEQMVQAGGDAVRWRRRLLDLQSESGRREQATRSARELLGEAVEAGDRARIAEMIQALQTLAPEDRSVRAEIVRAHDALGDVEAASAERLALAGLHRAAGDDSLAEDLYRDMLTTTPDGEEARAALVDLLIAGGRSEAAVNLLWERANALSAADRTAEETQALRRLLDIDGEHLEARQRLAELLRANLSNDEAVEQLAILAQQQADSGDVQQAIVTWEEVVSLRPEVVPYHQALITCQLSTGGGAPMQASVESLMSALIAREAFDDALGCLDRFEAFDPELPLWHRWRGEVLSAKGDEAGALTCFRRFSQLADKHISARVGRELGPGAAAAPGSSAETVGFRLVPDYTFETFIVGERNNFAFATCHAVAENPATAYNPLFLYSDVGLGKTHLINAIGNHIRRHHPKFRVLFTSVEEFITQLVDAIQRNRVNEFRARHRRLDVLLIDDVQFLAGKERAQEEFFHLFNTLHQARKQIVVTSDRPPREMTYLEKRLRSRFGAGVIVDIQPPDVETRIAIVQRAAAEATGARLPEDVIALLAERCASNVRELKGALNQLIALASTRKDPLPRDEASRALDALLEPVS